MISPILHLLRENPEDLLYVAGEVARTPALAARRYRLKLRRERPVGYIGWLGHRNLGDEAMFLVIAKRLAEIPIVPCLPVPGERFLASLGVGGPGYFRAVLLGGGTLINQLYLPAAALARSFGAPLYTVGTGVGSAGFGAPQDAPLAGWRDVFRDSEFLGVRGPLSKKQLEEAGIGGSSVTGDPALGLTPDVVPEFRSRKRLVINLAQEPGQRRSPAEDEMWKASTEIAREFVAKGGEVVGVTLGSGDFRALREFRALAGISGMRIRNHRTNPEGLLRTLAGSVGLIGVRLHSAVLACCAGVPPVLMAYRRKCEDFMASMDLQEFAVPVSKETGPALLRARWEEVMNRAELGSQIYQKALYWKGVQTVYFDRLTARIR